MEQQSASSYAQPSPVRRDVMVSVMLVSSHDGDIIEQAITEIAAVLAGRYSFYEILLVDNCSTDTTHSIMERLCQTEPNIRMLILARPYDLEIAMMAGLENCVGDFVAVLDMAHDPPGQLLTMFDKAMAGKDLIIAERRHRQGTGLVERIGIRSFYWLLSAVFRTPLSAQASYYRVMSRRAVNAIIRIKNKRRYLRYLNAFVGSSVDYVEYDRINRYAIASQRRALWPLVLYTIDLLLSNSIVPLRAAAMLGLVAGFLNVVFLGYVFVVSMVNTQVAPGWISSSVISSSMFLLVFVILAVIAEYIARILDEVRDSPLYFVSEEKTSVIFRAQHDMNVVD